MQLNCSIAFYCYLNRLCDAITARVLHSNCVYCPVGTTTLIATRSQRVQSLVTHSIIDEAAYLSEATK